jgi:flagellar basal body P-ring protein FlgI
MPRNRRDAVEQTLAEQFDDRVYAVEDGVVWVSGMNAHCKTVAQRMARELVAQDIPCGLVYDNGAARFGGVQFNWGEAA